MKYSKSEHEYFRNHKKENSIKGGKLKVNGKLEANDFSDKNHDYAIELSRLNSGNVKQRFKSKQNNNYAIELSRLDSRNVKSNQLYPIKIIKSASFIFKSEPYFFFGYNNRLKTYKYVCYNNLDPFTKESEPIICKQLVSYNNNSSEIVKLSHDDFLNIEIKDLVILCYYFLKIHKENPKFMKRLYKYLQEFVFGKVCSTRINNQMYRGMVNNITNHMFEKGHEIFNQHP